MRKKFLILSGVSLFIALAIFVFTFNLYHYYGPNGFDTICRELPTKPFITELFGIWGVCFLFASVMSFVVALLFFNKSKREK